MKLNWLAAVLGILLLASCAETAIAPDQLPRGFSQPNTFPYNGTGW